jgi:hypothetical protein
MSRLLTNFPVESPAKLETKAQPQAGASIHNASTCVDRGERSRPYSLETVMSAGGPRRRRILLLTDYAKGEACELNWTELN